MVAVIVSSSNLRVTDSFLKSKPAKAIDLDNPNMHFTLLFEEDTYLSCFMCKYSAPFIGD